MSGYWWGLLTIPLTAALVAVAFGLFTLGAWGLAKFGNVRLVHLQGTRGIYRNRINEVSYIATAPRAWCIDFGEYLGLTISCGKPDDQTRRQVASALEALEPRASLAEILGNRPGA